MYATNYEASNAKELQIISFRCGELLIGLEMTNVQEINRIDSLAHVPSAPLGVSGVINLRGDVVTMIDTRVILNQTSLVADRKKLHNVFVRYEGELIGLITDGVSDILTVARDQIDVPPSNLSGVDNASYKGIFTLPGGELMVILDLQQFLNSVIEQDVAA